MNIKNNTELKDDISLYKDIDQKNTQDKPMSVLLVEDNIDLQNFLACSFRDQYNVTTASNGVEAWAIIQSKSFDLIVRLQTNVHYSHLSVLSFKLS